MLHLFLIISLIPQIVFADTRAVAIIHRHGTRTAKATYPKNPCNITYTEGLGNLTETGRQSMNFHGKMLRLRYYALVHGMSSWKEHVIVKTSKSVRCVMSTESFLAGFFNEKNVSLSPESILPFEDDNMLACLADCQLYDQELNSLFAEYPKDLKKYFYEHPNYFEKLSDLTGMNITNIVQAGQTLYGIVLLDEVVGKCIPDWGLPFLHDSLVIYERSFSMQYESVYMQKAKCGTLLTDVVNNFDRFIDGSENKTFFVYSGHEFSLVCLARLLDIENQVAKIPDFGSTFNFDLDYNEGAKEHIVRLYYYASGNTILPNLLTIPGCKNPCPYWKLKELVKQFLFSPTETYSSFCSKD